MRTSVKKMLRLSESFWWALLALLCGCSTPRVSFFSNPPRAKVFAKAMNDSKGLLVGETPLSIESGLIAKKFSGTGPVSIEFQKEGYDSKTVFLSEVDVANMIVTAEMNPVNGLGDQQMINWILESAIEIQRLVKLKKYDSALKQIDDVQRVAPHLSTLHEMKGGVHYLKGQTADAFEAYSKALRLNPQSPESQRMVGLLRNLIRAEEVQERTPASQ